MLDALLVFSGLALLLGSVLGYLAFRFKADEDSLVQQIDNILPQTQCAQCNYPGCRPYAQAIADGEVDINQCPPGGQEGVDALAQLLGVETMPINIEHGVSKPKSVAVVDELLCIGCTLCIKVCPVDAFVGAAKVMTTVIASECTGCDLCVPVCPVDCIEMVVVKPTLGSYVPDINKLTYA